MAMRDLIPWNRGGGDATTRRADEIYPFLTLHREMNRVFDDVFRGFDFTPFGDDRTFGRSMGWPNIELNTTEEDVRVIAELPGLDEKDVQVELANGVLCIKGEKKTETEDKNRLFSEPITAISSGASRSRTWMRTRYRPHSKMAY